MEIKVRAVDSGESKSVQEVEQELLDKHEEKLENENITESVPETGGETPTPQEETETQSSELKEEDVLKYLGNRYGREIKSFDDLQQAREQEELPEDVSKYLQYKKETGRGFDDFAKLQVDYDEMDPDTLLKRYLTATEKGLDAEDIESLMEDYSYDEDVDDEKDIKKIKLAKKKTIAKAKDYFAKQQEKYRVPLESSGASIPQAEAEELERYRQYIAEAKTVEEQNSRRREVFLKKTDDVFSEFKGFEFTLGDDTVVFQPGDGAELKSAQLDPQNFIKKFLDDEGTLTDAVGYHRALAMAMHPDKFAKFFYEQGKSAAADEQMRKLKNVNMTTRSAPEVAKTKGGLQIKSVSQPSSRGLKIRKRK